jgi:hypothetical protein
MRTQGRFLCIVINFFACLTNAQTPDWEWVHGAGISANGTGTSVYTDNSDNTYLAGPILGIGSLGSFTINTGGLTMRNLYVAKYNNSGNVIWAHRIAFPIQGILQGDCTGIISDGSNGLFITGQFIGDLIFGIDSINTNGLQFSFIAKFDTSGNYQWVRTISGSGYVELNGISIDSMSNLYAIGSFRDSVFSNDTTVSFGNNDIFVLKYDSSGNYQWLKHFGSTAVDKGSNIATDVLGNCYITGSFGINISFDGNMLTSNGASDIFIAKLNKDGNVIWSKSAGGLGGDAGNGVSIYKNKCFIAGIIRDTVFFNTTPFLAYGYDAFISCYDTAGHFIWLKNSFGSQTELATSLSTDNMGYCFISGTYINTTTFEADTLYSYGGLNSADIFVAKYKDDGNLIWIRSGGSHGVESVYSISNNQSGECFISGIKNDSAIFGNISISSASTDAGPIFIAKIGCNSPQPIITLFDNSLMSSFAPTYQWFQNGVEISGANSQIFNASQNGIYVVEIIDSFGCKVSSSPFNLTTLNLYEAELNPVVVFPNPSDGIFEFHIPEMDFYVEIENIIGESILITKKKIINLTNFPKGIYFYKINSREHLLYSGKIILR